MPQETKDEQLIEALEEELKEHPECEPQPGVHDPDVWKYK